MGKVPMHLVKIMPLDNLPLLKYVLKYYYILMYQCYDNNDSNSVQDKS